jgi:AraC family transcriptional activator of pobA
LTSANISETRHARAAARAQGRSRNWIAGRLSAPHRVHRPARKAALYARRLDYSPRTLNRATQETVGRTAKQYVDDRVVLEAKRLLAHSDITVAECASRTGFDDPANFSKFFRARTGLTPGTFAARVRVP